MKTPILAVTAAAVLLTSAPARAGHGSCDAGWWALGGFVAGAITGAAIASSSDGVPACAPAPVVVVAPAPVFVVHRPAPVIIAAPPVYVPAPVYACPPVVYRPRPVVCAPPPVIVHRGPYHRHGYRAAVAYGR